MSRFSKFLKMPCAIPWPVTSMGRIVDAGRFREKCSRLDKSEDLIQDRPRERQNFSRQHKILEVVDARLDLVAGKPLD
jgi:hypothetical protein